MQQGRSDTSRERINALHMLESTASLFTASTVLPGIEEFNSYRVSGLFMCTWKCKAFRETHHKEKPCARSSTGECHLLSFVSDNKIHLIGFWSCRHNFCSTSHEILFGPHQHWTIKSSKETWKKSIKFYST